MASTSSNEAATEESVRAEVHDWLADHWNSDISLHEWRGLIADSGWGCPTWPTEFYGRGLSPDLSNVVADEFRKAGAVGPAIGVGMALAAPTLLAHAPADLKRRLLREIITGENTWCQLFSEPGNGSDLAGLTTRAWRDGDEWIVNGQKVWTTGAHHAAYGMLLARTDWDIPKHQGITFFAFPMEQAEIEVRPLQQMNYRSSFNEVFIAEARVPHNNIVGEVNGGWKVALTTLAHERNLSAGAFGGIPFGGKGKAAQEAISEAAAYMKTYDWYPQRAGRPDLVPLQAKEAGLNTDPIIRQELAKLYSLQRTSQWNVQRTRAARKMGRPPGPEGSLSKLCASNIARASNDAHSHVAGAHGMLTGPDSPASGTVAEVLISTPAASIAGGTDQIQRNIIGERVLGLPKEPQIDADLPFRDVRTNK